MLGASDLESNEMKKLADIVQSQEELCQKYQAECDPPDLGLKLGISKDFFSGKMPLNGLRHPREGDTCGWYLWAGEEFPGADDAFESLHIVHLVERASEVVKYFGLAPGWRFLMAGDYEDVWFDPKLLEV